jgi:hypothetical protein
MVAVAIYFQKKCLQQVSGARYSFSRHINQTETAPPVVLKTPFLP